MNLHFGLRSLLNPFKTRPMKKPALVRNFVLTLALALGLSACRPTADAQRRVADAHDRNDAPPIWVVEDYNSKLYLFGTIHLLPSDLDWQKDDMTKVFDGSGTVFFELDSEGQAGVDVVLLTQELGQYKGGERLSKSLDSYQLKLLEAVSHNGDIPIATLESMKPWLASELLTISAASNAGLSGTLSADETLKNRAKRLKKNVVFLDSAESQIRASSDLPDYVQMDIFVETMERFNGIGDELKTIANSWAKGDVKALRTQGASALKDRSPELYNSLILQRNRNWTNTFMKFMEESGDGFAAVGVGHLLGDDSVQNMLRDQGYDVSRYFAFQGEDLIKAAPLGSINPAESGN